MCRHKFPTMPQSLLSIPAGPRSFPSRPQPRLLNAVPSTTKVVRYPAGQGPHSHVTVQWCKGIPAKDTTLRTVSPLNGPLGLCKEEVRGQKIEQNIILPPGSSSLQLLPGGVFDSQVLLRSGDLTYLNIEAAHALKDSAQLENLPSRSSSSEMCWSTCQDGLGLNISGSYFFLSPAESKPFAFSSENYRHLYAYTFDQIFFTVRANDPGSTTERSPSHETLGEDALFLREVKVGRRIYVIIESETALEHHMNGIRRGLEWIMLSAKLQTPSFANKVKEQTKIRLQTQDNRILDALDITQLQATLDSYFESSSAENPLSPLSFQVSDLDGTPVSLLTTAFIDSQHSLSSPKAQVRLRKIELCRQGNTNRSTSKDIHGKIHLHLINELDRQPPSTSDHNSTDQHQGLAPAGTITLATAAKPLTLTEGEAQCFHATDPSTSLEINIPNLDRTVQIEAILNGEASWAEPNPTVGNKPVKKLRQLLLESSREITFPCKLGNAVLEVTVEIKPL
jgi:hypothetical protein